MQSAGATSELVLVGAGHAHVQVVRRFLMAPVPGVRLTLVLDRPEAVYSGMVPGFVAGDYAAHELEIDGVPLARRAGARVLLARATGIDVQARRVSLEGRPAIPWDVASLDVGSEVRGLELPGVADHALATRPIRRFVDALDARLLALRATQRPRVVVVGAGAAGCELAFTLDARLRAAGAAPALSIVGDGPRALDGYPPRVSARVEREASRRGIALRLGARVRGVSGDAVLLDDGEVAADLVVWAAGAAAPTFLAGSGLPVDSQGFVRVGPTLQVEGCPDLFAAGDCAALAFAPWVRKAGVYAVRAGPVLDANLRARLAGRPPRAFRPQRDFLTLLNLGGGRALGAKWGVVAAGRSVFRLKDAIDRRFVRRFRVLDAAGADAPGFPTRAMGARDMECGGCAAKLGPEPLARALARLPAAPPDPSVLLGLSQADDAAALQLPRGDVLLATIDAFPAFCDDPWLVGRAAAVNAVSDVLATGGVPRHALALVTVADADPRRAEESLYQVLAGIRAALDPLGVTLVGGHTTRGDELFVGLAVTGEPAEAGLLAKRGARPGDALILTKALGTGVLLAADMQGRLPGREVAAVHAALLRDNAAAARTARECGARAATDVSGFGLAGHLLELLRASGASARISLARVPALAGALPLIAKGLRSTYHGHNEALRGGLAIAPALAGDPRVDLLFDPQTCGGLLLALPAERAAAAVAALRRGGDAQAAAIGEITSAAGGDPHIQVEA